MVKHVFPGTGVSPALIERILSEDLSLSDNPVVARKEKKIIRAINVLSKGKGRKLKKKRLVPKPAKTSDIIFNRLCEVSQKLAEETQSDKPLLSKNIEPTASPLIEAPPPSGMATPANTEAEASAPNTPE